MKITFHGAARTVTGSRHLLEANGKKILLDCGLVQGRRDEAEARNRKFPFDPAEIDAVVLSHAHIDHSGALPALVKRGFKGTIHSTLATGDLAVHMLRDSAYIQEKDAEYVNKRNRRKWKKKGRHESDFNARVPLYTIDDAERTIEQFTGQRYGTPFEVVPGVYCTYRDAGHMLGSATVTLNVQENGQERSIAFSGDIGRTMTPIIRDPQAIDAPDVLLMESTYGGRTHAPKEKVEEKLAEVMNKVCLRKGKLIIPAFSVGRTQEIVYHLTKMRRAGKIPNCPIFVDSPLATRVTDVFDRHPECYDAEIREIFRESGDPFGFEEITYTRSVEESKALNTRKGPFTVISASGMMEAGRILHHLANGISNPDNAVLVVGYQAHHTLGRKIVRGDKEVKIYGEPYPLRAEVIVMDEFSAHADRDELMTWYEGNRSQPKKVFLVHGDEKQSLALAETMEAKTSAKIEVPHLDQTFTL